MDSLDGQAGQDSGAVRVLRRWALPDASRRQQRTAVALNLGGLALAALGFALARPASDWSDPALLVALGAIAGVAFLAEGELKGVGAFFSATIICALVALVVAGPGPALCVWLVPDVLNRLVLRGTALLTPGLFANVASFALALLAGQAVLSIAQAPTTAAALPAIYCAGLVMWAVNFVFARLCFGPFYGGFAVRALVREEFFAVAPEMLAMLLVALGTIALIGPLGAAGLAPLAAVILLPQLAIERLARARAAAALDAGEATALYAAALADVLGVPRSERHVLACAADLVEPSGDVLDVPGTEWDRVEASEAAFIALHVNERWEGNGIPAGLPAEAIPRGSRVIAVARAWARLTCSGGQELPQREAMLALAAESGVAFDPEVVDAATQVVADEEGYTAEPSFAPRLHRVWLPQALRRGVLPAVLEGAKARAQV